MTRKKKPQRPVPAPSYLRAYGSRRWSPDALRGLIAGVSALPDSRGKCATIAKIAAAANVTSETVRNWSAGKTEPTVSDAIIVADTLGVDFDALIEDCR